MNKIALTIGMFLSTALTIKCMDNLPPAMPLVLPMALPANPIPMPLNLPATISPAPGAPAPKTQEDIEEGRRRFFAKQAMYQSPVLDVNSLLQANDQQSDQKANAAEQEKKKATSKSND